MRWRKLGRIVSSEGQFPWMVSHASVPFAEKVDGDLYRVYFTSRDRQNRSHIGWLELDINRPDRILRLSDTPVLAPGALGRFDDRGAMMSWLVRHDGQRHFYYVGWNTRASVPFHVSIGLAVGPESGQDPVVTSYPGPILERGMIDPFFCSNPCVLVENGRWRMWYLSGLGWADLAGRASASYDVRYAESDDGRHWRRTGRVAIGLEPPHEFAIARPCVLREPEGYVMWYCVRLRDRPYRLGVARSPDGLAWEREQGDPGLGPSEDGWDSEMVAYPHVFDHGPDRYMLYCGNGFGRTGFGLAVRE
jgi:predicted GH43/DUF377 family glycosyl hydrolase